VSVTWKVTAPAARSRTREGSKRPGPWW
jgi:hypothetical protein